MEIIEINSGKRSELIDITGHVDEIISRSKINTGICAIFVPHTTAGILINENYDPSVKEDMISSLNRLIPADSCNYAHTEGNSDAHIKSSLVGTNLVVPVSGNKIVLGKWQGIFFAEFDGPRRRQVFISLLEQK